MYHLPSDKEISSFAKSLKELPKKASKELFDEVAKLSLKLDGPIFGVILKACRGEVATKDSIVSALRQGEEQEGTEPIAAMSGAHWEVECILRKFKEGK